MAEKSSVSDVEPESRDNSSTHARRNDKRMSFQKRPEDVPVFFKTGDKVRLAVYHYPPDSPLENAPPVILCPGVSCDHYFFDPHVGPSLARFLRDQGFDVWILDVRGHGNSQKPAGVFSFLNWRQDIDLYIKYDVPAAVEFVKSKTGAPSVFWIGHSRGGAIAYGHMIKNNQEDFHGAIMMAGAGGMATSTITHHLIRLGSLAGPFLPANTRQPTALITKAISYMPGQSLIYKSFLYRIVMNHRNMDHDVIRYFNRYLIQPLPTNEFTQLMKCYRKEALLSRDGRYNYTDHVDRIRRPVLCVTGVYDELISPRCVESFFDRIGSEDKTHVILSRKNKFSADYGHADMILGKKAEQEVFPIVSDWMKKRLFVPPAKGR